MAAHHQPARRSIDFREHGVGGNNIFKAIGHGGSPQHLRP
jgi:hypothetical protein